MKKYAILAIVLLTGLVSGFAWFFHVKADTEHDTDHPEAAAQAKAESENENDQVLVVAVKAERLDREVSLPAELEAFRDVAIHAKVPGYVQTITVDRGSVVHKGQLLIKLMAPEVEAQCKKAGAAVESCKAQLSEALSKLKSSEAHLQESRAKLDKDSAIHARLETAAKVPGTISGGELDKSARDVDFDQAHVRSVEEEVHAAKSIVEARKKQVSAAQQEYKAMESTLEYLTIKAPFEGVITERNVHEGSLVGFESDKTARIALRIQQISTLRLVVYVPEDDVSGVIPGTSMEFAVKAYPGRRFTGVVKRVGHALDRETRTMPVELDVKNGDGKLEPGMFANVFWPEKRPYDTLFVPSTAVFTSLSGDFVIKVDGDRTNVVKVTRGKTVNDLQEVFGNLKGGDRVVLHGSEEMESGTRVQARLATSKDL